MRGVGTVLSAAVTVVGVVALAGCGGGGGGSAEPTESKVSVAGADERTVTVSAVQGDVRAAVAAGGFGRPAFADERSATMRRHPCQVAARVRTHTAPDRKAVERVVAELKDRGWTADEPFADESGIGWGLDRDDWTLSVEAGETYSQEMWAALPPEEADMDGEFNWVVIFGFGGDCGLGTVTPTP
ncbi:hypothetical protein ACWDR3_00410 [Streptomyces sp. NPDC001002]